MADCYCETAEFTVEQARLELARHQHEGWQPCPLRPLLNIIISCDAA